MSKIPTKKPPASDSSLQSHKRASGKNLKQRVLN
jgi:hypothetical protein